MLFSSISEHLHEVRDLVDHSAHGGRVFQRRLAVELAQAESAHGGAVRLARAGDALDELDLHGRRSLGLVSHRVLSLRRLLSP